MIIRKECEFMRIQTSFCATVAQLIIIDTIQLMKGVMKWRYTVKQPSQIVLRNCCMDVSIVRMMVCIVRKDDWDIYKGEIRL